MPKNSINDLAAIVARKRKISKKEAADIVTAFFNTIADGLRDDRQVKVRGLGTFKVTAVKARESVNVNTGERVIIEGHDKVTFVPDQSMKDLVNKPFADFTTVVVNDGVNFDSVDAAAAAEERKISAQQEPEPEESESTEPDEQAEDSFQTDEQTIQTEAPSNTDEQTIQAETPSKTDEQAEETGGPEEQPSVEYDVAMQRPEQPSEQAEEVFKSELPGKEETGEDEESQTVPDAVTSTPTQQVVAKSADDPSNEDDDDEAQNVSREYFDEQIASCRRRCNRNLVLSIVLLLIGLVAGFFIGRYAFLPSLAPAAQVKDSSTEAKVEKPVEKPVAAPEPKDTVQPTDTQKVEQKEEGKVEEQTSKASEAEEDDIDPDFKKLNSDRRLRFGAYEIIGVDKVVKLKKGQTMQSYSNKTLGKDMVVYFQVLNGVNDVKEGETLKVPKIRLKKQYRK